MMHVIQVTKEPFEVQGCYISTYLAAMSDMPTS